jgi:RasGEF N-terminal motif
LIMHASLDRLFEQLGEAVTNSQFGDVFTVVHSYFISSEELVRELLSRCFFRHASNATSVSITSGTNTEGSESLADRKRAQVRRKVMIVRIGNFLRKWLSYNAYRIRVDVCE